MIPSRQSATSSLADSLLQVCFDFVCLFTFWESQVDRSYPYLARFGHKVALCVHSISSFSMHMTIFPSYSYSERNHHDGKFCLRFKGCKIFDVFLDEKDNHSTNLCLNCSIFPVGTVGTIYTIRALEIPTEYTYHLTFSWVKAQRN